MSATANFAWLAGHELRLSWRDWAWMMTGGRHARAWWVAIGLGIFIAFLHLVAFLMVLPYAGIGIDPDRSTLLAVSGGGFLTWTLMLSQAMELVTRAFYGRADLDLILSSPVPTSRVFAIRVGAIAFSTVITAALLAGPFINVLVIAGGPRWLSAFGMLVAAGFAATALAVILTIALFHAIGPRATRLVAQVVAALIGSMFVIGVQGVAVVYYGTLSRFAFFESDLALSIAPALDSLSWLPARAIMGDWRALFLVLGASLILLGLVVAIFSGRFADYTIAAQGVSRGIVRRHWRGRYRVGSAGQMLRRKEWKLLLRDPWLISQTLMQLLYLLPPGLLLWRGYGEGLGLMIVLAPVLVMAAGQLSGGLAWLAVSGEDAPDLLASAPISESAIIRAKIEAVLFGIAIVFLPFVAGLIPVSLGAAIVVALGVAASAASAAKIQLWFRSQAKRSNFRRRQTSSRIATFAEAFSSITWAGAAGLGVVGSWFALVPVVIAFGVLGLARALSPK